MRDSENERAISGYYQDVFRLKVEFLDQSISDEFVQVGGKRKLGSMTEHNDTQGKIVNLLNEGDLGQNDPFKMVDASDQSFNLKDKDIE